MEGCPIGRGGFLLAEMYYCLGGLFGGAAVGGNSPPILGGVARGEVALCLFYPETLKMTIILVREIPLPYPNSFDNCV